ncbi:MAG: ribosome maturation factor RimM [Candidatus Aminicenantia bacterium]
MIKIGRIRGPRGRGGELEVEIYSPFPERFSQLKTVFIGSFSYKIENVRSAGKKVIIKVEGIGTIDSAEKLRNCEIEILEEEINPLPDNYFYLHDLKGCIVFLKDGTVVGIVSYIWEIGENTLLSVSGSKGEILIPFVKSICRIVDVKNKRIEIDPPDGLLNLNEI